MKKILFCGTGSFAARCLKQILKLPKFEPIVVTSFPKFKNKKKELFEKNEVLKLAENSALQVINAPNTMRFKLDEWQQANIPLFESCEIGIVSDFGYFLPKEFVKLPEYGFLNIHPSLLPKYRGATPIQHTLINGDKEAGVSIVRINPDAKRFDTGDVVVQQKSEVQPEATYTSLLQNLSSVASEMMYQVLESNLYKDMSSDTKQSMLSEKPSRAPIIKIEDSFIKWNDQTAEDVINSFRGLAENMGLRTKLHDKVLKILDMDLKPFTSENESEINFEQDLVPGQVSFNLSNRKRIVVKCKDGFVGILSYHPESKKPMNASDFYNGFMKKSASMPLFGY